MTERKYCCVICAARWIEWEDGTWTLASADSGPCCNNVAMDKAPIVPFEEDGSINGDDANQVLRGAAAGRHRRPSTHERAAADGPDAVVADRDA